MSLKNFIDQEIITSLIQKQQNTFDNISVADNFTIGSSSDDSVVFNSRVASSIDMSNNDIKNINNLNINGLITQSCTDDLDVITLDKNTSFVDYNNLQNTFYTKIGSSGDELNPQMSMDSSGSIYMTGVFTSDELGIYDFTNNTIPIGSLTKDGIQSLFITKYNEAGVNMWKTKITGYNEKTEPSIYSGGNGDTVVTMQSYDDCHIKIYDAPHGNSAVKILEGVPYNVANTLLVKYNTDGMFKWNARVKIVNYPDEKFSSNAVVTGDLEGNVYLTGYYPGYNSTHGGKIEIYDITSDTIPAKTFTNGRSESLYSYFIIKFDSTGKCLWVNHINGNLNGGEFGTPFPDIIKLVKISINTDISNNLYLTSTFNPICNELPDLAIYKPGTNIIVKEIKVAAAFLYNRAIFNVKFDSSGNYLWNNMILGKIPFDASENGIVQSSNCVDVSGNMYLTFSNFFLSEYNVIDTDTSLEEPVYTFTNTQEISFFGSLMKFDTNGRFIWNNYIKCNNTDTNNDIPNFIFNPVITCDNRYINNNLKASIYLQINAFLDNYIGGINFYNSNALKNVAYTLPNKEYYIDDDTMHSILAKYDSDGMFQWACTSGAYIGGGETELFGLISSSIVADKEGHVYIGGAYYDNLYIWDVETNGPYDDNKGLLTNEGGFDIYMIKYNRYGLLNNSINRNIYIEDIPTNNTNTKLIPDGIEKSIIITNNENAGPIDCLILEKSKTGFAYQVRRSVTLVDSLDLVCKDNKWIPKLQTEQYSISNDLDVIDVNTKLSVVNYDDISNASWYTRIGGTSNGNEQNCSMSTDKNGNIVMVGTYTSDPVRINFLYGTSYVPLNRYNGERDVFIAKYQPNGTLAWATHIGFDTNIGNEPNVHTDAEGNTYVTIVKTDDLSGNTIYIYDTRSNSDIQKEVTLNNSSTIVIKYDKDGIYQWNIRIQANYTESAGTSDSLCVADVNGNVYVAGYQLDDCSGVKIYDSSEELIETQYGHNGSFICKFDKIGKYIWSIANKCRNVPNYKISIACDTNNNIVLTGIYSGTTNIYNIVNGNRILYKSLCPKSGNYGAYIIKYNSDGKALWHTGLFMDTSSILDQVINPVSAMDGDGNFYLSAEVIGEQVYIYDTRAPKTARQIVNLPSESISNTILIKYNANGIIQWYTFVSGVSGKPSISVNNRYIKGLKTNSVFISGSYDSSGVILYNGTSSGFPNSACILSLFNTNNVYIARYDSNGVFDWASKAGGSTTNMNSSIVATKDGHVYLAGEFNSETLTVYQGRSILNDPNSNYAVTINNNNTGSYDIFLVKYNRYGIVNNGNGTSDFTGDLSGNYRFSRELFLENNNKIPNGTEKTIIISNNIQNNNNTAPTNVCLMVIDKNTNILNGYYPYRTIWFCEGVTMVSNNGKWLMKSSSTGDGMPKRSIVMWGGDQYDIPAGWALCNGQIFHGVTTPDLRGRFVLGYNADSVVDTNTLAGITGARAPQNAVGNVSGEYHHQSSIGETPAHTHGIIDPTHTHIVNDPTHSHECEANDAGSTSGSFGQSTGSDNLIGFRGNLTTNSSTTGVTNQHAATGITNKYTGGKNSDISGNTDYSPIGLTWPTGNGTTVPHNNMPPYFVLAYIMKCY